MHWDFQLRFLRHFRCFLSLLFGFTIHERLLGTGALLGVNENIIFILKEIKSDMKD
jgi:hypothetical protein